MRATRLAAVCLAVLLVAAACGNGGTSDEAAWCEASWREVLEAFYGEFNGTATMDEVTNGYLEWVDLTTGTTLPETSMAAYLRELHPAEYAQACTAAYQGR
jgi:ABC-type glycerol-3-phosphate transport system substrate-binding protein